MIMRYGFTTGSCAAAASKAAAYMLLTGKAKNKITIQTPKGIAYTADITDIKRSENEVSCAVIKDGGDDRSLYICFCTDFAFRYLCVMQKKAGFGYYKYRRW